MVRTSRQGKQIFKIDGNNCFMEILNDRFFEGKVVFNFSSYDKEKERGERIAQEIKFFLTFGDALTFCEMVLDGTFKRKLHDDRKAYRASLLNEEKTGQKSTYFYGNPYWALSRGTEASKLNPKREDGKSESRKLSLQPGYVPKDRMLNPSDPKFKNKRKPNRFVIVCESGPGDKVESKVQGGFIIKPSYGNTPEKKIMIPIPEIESPEMNYVDKLTEMAKILQANILGYIQAGYAYEFMNPAPGIISANAVHQQIKVGDVLDIVIYTPSNVTKIEAMIQDKNGKPHVIQPDEEFVGVPTETNTLEWHFRKRANKVSNSTFEFLPYVGYEKGDFTKRCYIKVSDK